MENIALPYIIFFGVISLILFLALQRWFLAIDAQLKNQKAIIDLLNKIAGQQGSEAADLQELKNIKG